MKEVKNNGLMVVKPKIKRKKRKKRYKIKTEIKLYLLISTFCAIFIFVLFTVFFNINSISVSGHERYSAEEIIEVSGLKQGDNILVCDKNKAAQRIFDAFPYIEKVKIEKILPSAVEINIQMAEVDCAVRIDDEFLLVSKSGKILEKINEKPEDILIINGGSLKSYKECQSIEYINEKVDGTLLNLRQNIQNSGLESINEIDCQNPDKITLIYENRIKIFVGDGENLDYKMLTAREIIKNKIADWERGELNVSSVEKDGKSYFNPENM